MVWPVYDAKAHFSELLDAALKDSPKRSVIDVLLDPNGPHDLYIPPRRTLVTRTRRSKA